MINNGKIVADGPLADICNQASGGVRYHVELKGSADDNLAVLVSDLPGVDTVTPGTTSEGFQELIVRAPSDPRTAIAGLATANAWQIKAMEKVTPRLEEAFLSIIGRES